MHWLQNNKKQLSLPSSLFLGACVAGVSTAVSLWPGAAACELDSPAHAHYAVAMATCCAVFGLFCSMLLRAVFIICRCWGDTTPLFSASFPSARCVGHCSILCSETIRIWNAGCALLEKPGARFLRQVFAAIESTLIQLALDGVVQDSCLHPAGFLTFTQNWCCHGFFDASKHLHALLSTGSCWRCGRGAELHFLPYSLMLMC